MNRSRDKYVNLLTGQRLNLIINEITHYNINFAGIGSLSPG